MSTYQDSCLYTITTYTICFSMFLGRSKAFIPIHCGLPTNLHLAASCDRNQPPSKTSQTSLFFGKNRCFFRGGCKETTIPIKPLLQEDGLPEPFCFTHPFWHKAHNSYIILPIKISRPATGQVAFCIQKRVAAYKTMSSHVLKYAQKMTWS